MTRPRAAAFLAYAATLLLTVAALIVVLRLWKADPAVPFSYQGDALEHSLYVKGVVDNGWYQTNGFLGMPQGFTMGDVPFSDNLHFLIVKLLAFFMSDWASILNAYFLLTFPLTALCSLFVLRRFELSYAPSIAASLLYAFLPYHFSRGEIHPFLAAYYAVPLMVMVVLWICSGKLALADSRGGFRALLVDKRFIAGAAVCLLMASSGLYYAFFSCLFLLVAGARGSVLRRSRGPVIVSALLAFTIAAAVLASLLPTIRYQRVNGENPYMLPRSPQESEAAGLKIAQLLLPVRGHKIHFLAELRERYDRTAPLVNENSWASLGLAGSLGFVLLLAAALFRKEKFLGSELLADLSVLNISGVLYATIGGFGSLFAYLIFPDFRGLNRISIFIGFYSLFAVAIVLDMLLKRVAASRPAALIFSVAVAAVVVAGIWDQTGWELAPRYDAVKAEYLDDARFVAAIEAAMPDRAMIFQLPVMPFEESRLGFEHLKGYLHSNRLRWSFGAMGGRECLRWQEWVESKAPDAFVEAIGTAGFKGVSIDRSVYPDGGAALEARLSALLNKAPLVSGDKRRAFFDLSAYLSARRSAGDGLRAPLAETDNIEYRLDSFGALKGYVYVSGWARVRGASRGRRPIFLTLSSTGRTYLFPLGRDERGLFSDVIAEYGLQNGVYKVGLRIGDGGFAAFRYTDKTIRIEL